MFMWEIIIGVCGLVSGVVFFWLRNRTKVTVEVKVGTFYPIQRCWVITVRNLGSTTVHLDQIGVILDKVDPIMVSYPNKMRYLPKCLEPGASHTFGVRPDTEELKSVTGSWRFVLFTGVGKCCYSREVRSAEIDLPPAK